MKDSSLINLKNLLLEHPGPISLTWLLVIAENSLIALIPLLIGLAIDDLLGGQVKGLIWLSICFTGLITIAVLRRIYDTRIYSRIRIRLAMRTWQRHHTEDISIINARMDMARELADFLEQELPETLTAVIQMSIAFILLWQFSNTLAFSSALAALVIIVIYGLFHNRFYHQNARLNACTEQQVSIIRQNNKRQLFSFLRQLRQAEVRLSDTEAFTYGLIFLVSFGYIIFNLWHTSAMGNMTPGMIFTLITYSWEYTEAAIMMPVALQSLTRLNEITHRINAITPPVNAYD